MSFPVEDKRALIVMEKSVKMVKGHIQVALPWRGDQLDIANKKIMAEKRLRSLQARLKKDTKLFTRYTKAMETYIEKEHSQRVPNDELNKTEGRRYLTHHPVTHRLKPDTIQIVFDCAAKFNGVSQPVFAKWS